MSENDKLQLLFTNIYSKVRSIKVGDSFDKAVEKEASKTYVGMDDNCFFQQLCDLIFQSGVRGVVWQKCESEIRKEFADYNVRKVAKFAKKDVVRILYNPKMLKNRRKVEACIHNAKTIVKLSKENGGFWRWLDSYAKNIEECVEKLKTNLM